MQALNALPAEAFVAQLQGIFEHSPWVAERVAGLRPFATREQLHQAMCAAVDAATSAQQLALIRAHPKLGARGAVRAALTQASATEQRRAGLTDCTPEELERLEALNTAYGNKFGFPFIIAVRGHDPDLDPGSYGTAAGTHGGGGAADRAAADRAHRRLPAGGAHRLAHAQNAPPSGGRGLGFPCHRHCIRLVRLTDVRTLLAQCRCQDRPEGADVAHRTRAGLTTGSSVHGDKRVLPDRVTWPNAHC